MININDYELVNVQKLEDEVLAKFHAAYPPNTDESGRGGFPSTERMSDTYEIQRWFKLIRTNTYTIRKALEEKDPCS